MSDLPPIEYLDEAARQAGYPSWMFARDTALAATSTSVRAHARALHQLAQARAELAALKPRETLEDVARREATAHSKIPIHQQDFAAGFLRGVQMKRDGVLPDE